MQLYKGANLKTFSYPPPYPSGNHDFSDFLFRVPGSVKTFWKNILTTFGEQKDMDALGERVKLNLHFAKIFCVWIYYNSRLINTDF